MKYSWPTAHFKDDSLYFTGWYKEKMIFKSGEDTLAVENGGYLGAMFLAKVSLDGSLEWAANIAGQNDAEFVPPLMD